MTYFDFAEALGARILADLEAQKLAPTACMGPDLNECCRVEASEARVAEVGVASLEEAVVKAEALREQRRQEPHAAAKRVAALEAHITLLEEAAAEAEALDEQQHHQAQTAAKRIEALQAHIATLENAVAKAEDLGEQRRREAQAAAKRVDDLVAELMEMTIELVEMSKLMTEQKAPMEKLWHNSTSIRLR